MVIRSAFWVGTPQAGTETEFRREIDASIVPAMRAFPGVDDVKALWPQQFEDQPPAIACQIIVQFAGAAELKKMLASPERAALRPRVHALAARFDGSLSHIDYEVGA
jgi:antibiotic biosynthesis monooxygenase (ABM) superfamily enzyme